MKHRRRTENTLHETAHTHTNTPHKVQATLRKQTLPRNVHHKEGRNPLKRLNTKKAGLLYGLVLFSYTSYALLDTFVIPHPMKTVLAESANIEATSGIKESIEAKINEKLGLSESAETSLTENTNGISSYSTGQSASEAENSSGSAGSSSEANDTSENSANTGGSTNLTASSTVEGGTIIGSYSDSNVSITLKEYREYDSAIYVADVTVSDVSYLKTALASNTYGRNITDTTSDMASENNAILAINGDYYGARQSGYVIRNGSLYRNSSGNRDALAIMKNGEFRFQQKLFLKMEPCRYFPSVRCSYKTAVFPLRKMRKSAWLWPVTREPRSAISERTTMSLWFRTEEQVKAQDSVSMSWQAL